jgi:hypothetical protein
MPACVITAHDGMILFSKGSRAVTMHDESFMHRCEESIPNECDLEHGFGSCWLLAPDLAPESDRGLTACVDNLAEYQRAAAAGASTSDVPLSVCSCEALPGCWVGDGRGGCQQACDESACVQLAEGQGRICVEPRTAGRMPLAHNLGALYSNLCLHTRSTLNAPTPWAAHS